MGLVHYASRDAMDIETFNEKTARQLYDALGVRDAADLYALNRKPSRPCPGLPRKKPTT